MGYIVYFCLGILFQYGVYGEPQSIMNAVSYTHLTLPTNREV